MSQGSPSWRARRAGLLGMPGGYDGYLASLRRVADYVVNVRPNSDQLQSWMREAFAITAGSAYSRWRSLCRAGLLIDSHGTSNISASCDEWRRTENPTPLITEIHRNIRFVGEFLVLLDAPLSTEQLRHSANERYRMGWQSVAQLNFRRGWLQSAGLLTAQNFGDTLMRTESGSTLVEELQIEPSLT